jgi:C4-dicarboxylate-specific signal transduction histidine kinase
MRLPQLPFFRHNRKQNYALLRRTVSARKKEERAAAIFNALKDCQQKLSQQEKMTTLGLLTAGVVHDLNNHFNFISGGIEALRTNLTDWLNLNEREGEKSLEAQSDILESLHTIAEGLDRGSKTIQSLKTFSGQQEEELIATSIKQSVETALTILTFKLREAKVEVIKNYTNDSVVLGNPSSLSRVFLNIIDNAIDAVNDSDIKRIEVQVSSNDGKVTAVIRDSGCGMSLVESSKIFDPFYTSKELGKGTGLGLFIAHEIIANHGGKISFKSELAKGTEFSVLLKAVPPTENTATYD